ncbi:MAG: tetratricopeptide repeat protein, partial [Delftia sp.]|nr:tetratricopeptide repeat protein [Delftia sp.]
VGYYTRLMGMVALTEKAHAEAEGLLRESVAAFREIKQYFEMATSLADLGIAARGLAKHAQARQHLCEALRTGAEIGALPVLITSLPTIALLLADQGEGEQAVELYALASRYPHVANSRWFEDVVGQHIAAVAAALPPEVVAAAQERGWACNLQATVAGLLVELEKGN